MSVLPTLDFPRQIDVLEIGCGSGSMCRRLAGLGFSGSYVGVDIKDRFDRAAVAGFDKTLVMADITTWEPDRRFDLILSVSALEHIPGDARLIERARSWLKRGGRQLHILPAPWALPLYLWHGYRQYGLGRLATMFDARARIFRLGGVISVAVHLLFITVPELLLRVPLRQRLPRLYERAAGACRADARLASRPAVHYAVVE
jgi:SAM-dependent methyltransferase